MDCEQALEYISASLDGELTGQEQAALAEHLVNCDQCRALAAEFGALSAGLSALEAEPPPGLSEQIMAAVAASDAVHPEGGDKVVPISAWRRWKPVRSVAAMLAVAVCLGGVLLWSNLGGIGADSADNMAAPAAMEPADAAPYTMDGPVADASEPEASVEGETRAAGDYGCMNTALEDGSENPDFASADLPEEPEAAAEPMPAPSSAPQSPAGDGKDGDRLSGASSPAAMTTSKTDLTQDEALELVFEFLGGSTAYPDAMLEEENGYVLAGVEENGRAGKRRLVFETYSPNGSCYIFRLYDSFWSDAGGGERAVTVNRYAVVMDGHQVLEGGTADYAQAVS